MISEKNSPVINAKLCYLELKKSTNKEEIKHTWLIIAFS